MNAAPGNGQPLRGQVVEWLMRLDAAPHDAGLRAEFEGWLSQSERHRKAYSDVEPIWRLSPDLSPPPAASGSGIADQSRSVPRSRRLRHVVAAAGGVLAACMFLYLYPVLRLHLEADYVTGVAQQRDLTLEDGSKVRLDADSAVAVRFSAATREVALFAGQAFFEVTPQRDRPFVVKARDVAVTVTGTAFSVEASRAGILVAVQSGSVEVATDGGQRPAASLTRGDRLRVGRHGEIARSRVEPDDVASWRDRRLVVYDTTIRDVVEQLGRYYDGVIVFRDDAFAGRRVTGVIDLQSPVEALQALVELQQGSMIRITPYLTVLSSR